MRNLQLAAALASLIVGAGMAFVAYGSRPAEPRRTGNLTMSGLTTVVDADRRLTVRVGVRNAGLDVSSPALLFVQFPGGERRDRLAPLPPGGARTWAWRSAPLPPGDHELTVSIEPESNAAEGDRDRLERRVVHVPAGRLPGGTRSARMPSLIGLTREQAARTLRRHRLPDPGWYEHRDRIAVDAVAQQWPDPGTPIAWGARPVLVLAAATVVPDVSGMPLARARDGLRAAGLAIDSLDIERSTHFGAETVVSQTPAPGTRVALDSGVALDVVQPLPVRPFAIAGGLIVAGLLLVPRPLFAARSARPRDAPLEPVAAPPVRRESASPREAAVALPSPSLGAATLAATEARAFSTPGPAPPTAQGPEREPPALPGRDATPAEEVVECSLDAEAWRATIRFVPAIDPGVRTLARQPATVADAVQLLVVGDPGRREVAWRS